MQAVQEHGGADSTTTHAQVNRQGSTCVLLMGIHAVGFNNAGPYVQEKTAPAGAVLLQAAHTTHMSWLRCTLTS
jgi:hypothetical protein